MAKEKQDATSSQATGPELAEIELGKIERNPWNPRKTAVTEEEMQRLKDSIVSVGQTTAVILRPSPEKAGHFQIADGWLRFNIVRALGRKTILAVVRPLTDRQMKIYGLAANTSIQVRDSDWEKAVQEIYESEYKSDEPKKHSKQDPEYPGLNEMARETGLNRNSLLRVLMSRDLRDTVVEDAPKEIRRLVKPASASDPKVSTKDIYELRDIIEKAPKAAQVLLEGLDPENKVIKSSDLSEHVKMVKAAQTPQEQEHVAEKIIERARAEQKIIEAAKRETRRELGEVTKPGGELTPEGREKSRTEERTKADEEQRKAEGEALKAVQTKAKVDVELKTTYELAKLEMADLMSEERLDQIARIRDESVKTAAIEAVLTIFAYAKKGYERFKGQ